MTAHIAPFSPIGKAFQELVGEVLAVGEAMPGEGVFRQTSSIYEAKLLQIKFSHWRQTLRKYANPEKRGYQEFLPILDQADRITSRLSYNPLGVVFIDMLSLSSFAAARPHFAAQVDVSRMVADQYDSERFNAPPSPIAPRRAQPAEGIVQSQLQPAEHNSSSESTDAPIDMSKIPESISDILTKQKPRDRASEVVKEILNSPQSQSATNTPTDVPTRPSFVDLLNRGLSPSPAQPAEGREQSPIGKDDK